MLNSRLGLFSAAIRRWHPFSRSYGVILPSSLTTLLPSALGFSPHLPVSVYGTGTYQSIAAFLGSMDSGASLLYFDPRNASTFSSDGFAYHSAFALAPVFPFLALPILLRPHSSVHMRYRNLNLLSIGYGFRPHLRSRLTQRRSALLWKP